MKLTFCFLLSILAFACSPDFHKQKYTNFAHGKAPGLKSAKSPSQDTPDLVLESSHAKENLEKSGEEILAAERPHAKDSASSPDKTPGYTARLRFPDPLTVPEILDDSLKTTAPTLADTNEAIIYSHQLKRESKRNLIIGIAEIAVGLLALLFLPYWLPILIVHTVVGLIFILIASHKFSKAGDVSNNPGKYKSPVRKYKLSTGMFSLSHVGYILLIIAILAFLLLLLIVLSTGFTLSLLALIILLVIPLPVAVIALVFLLIAAIMGRNFVRGENLQNIIHPSGSRVRWYNAINWSLIAVAFTSIVVSLSALFAQ